MCESCESRERCNRWPHFEYLLLFSCSAVLLVLLCFSLLDYSIYMCSQSDCWLLLPSRSLSGTLSASSSCTATARPVSASACCRQRRESLHESRQAKALKGKKDSLFDRQSQIGMDKLKIAQLICHCVDSIFVCSGPKPSPQSTVHSPCQIQLAPFPNPSAALATNLKRIVGDLQWQHWTHLSLYVPQLGCIPSYHLNEM